MENYISLTLHYYLLFTDYFLEKVKANQINELHFKESLGFFKDSFLKFHNAGLFPQLKRLIIDQDDRYGPKIHDENICEFEMWKLNDLPKILEDLATIKDLQIWSLKTSLEIDPDQSVSIY